MNNADNLFIGFFWIVCSLAGSARASDNQYRVEIQKVEEFHQALLQVMQSANATEREKLLSPRVKTLYEVWDEHGGR